MCKVKRNFNIKEIKAIIPHRYPFLMIDKIEDSGPNFAIGIKNVSINEPYFDGHFPDNPIVPGVLITESILQTTAFIGFEKAKNERDVKKHFFCAGFNMKFNYPVIPGDRLRIEVKLIRHLNNIIKVKAVVKNEKETVALGDLNLVTVDDKDSYE